MALALVLHALATETASGSGAAVDLGTFSTARVDLGVSAVAGTIPSLIVGVESSVDGLSGWRSVGALGPVTAAGPLTTTLAGVERYLRGAWVISGTTPAFTFAVTAQPQSQYASIADVRELSLPATALEPPVGMTQLAFDTAVNAILVAISAKVDDYLRGRHIVPLSGGLGPPSSYPEQFTKAVADIAAYEILVTFGFNPGEYDENFKTRAEAQWAWLRDIAKGVIVVDLPVPSPGDPGATVGRRGGRIYSNWSRGW
jgi:phage gp36-like protein